MRSTFTSSTHTNRNWNWNLNAVHHIGIYGTTYIDQSAVRTAVSTENVNKTTSGVILMKFSLLLIGLMIAFYYSYSTFPLKHKHKLTHRWN